MDVEANENDDLYPEDDMSEETNNDDENETIPTASHLGGEEMNQNDEDKEKEDDQDEEKEEDKFDFDSKETSQNSQQEDAHGITDKNGQDNVKKQDEDEDLEAEDKENGDGNDNDNNGNSQDEDNSNTRGNQGNDDSGNDNWQSTDGDDKESPSNKNTDDTPNPFRDPGDAEKFWHRKLNMIGDSPDDDEQENVTEENNETEDNVNPHGMFEYSSRNEPSSAQVLGAVEEETLDITHEKENQNNEDAKSKVDKDLERTENKNEQPKKPKKNDKQKEISEKEAKVDENDFSESDVDQSIKNSEDIDSVSSSNEEIEIEVDKQHEENKVVTDLSQLQLREDEPTLHNNEGNIIIDRDEIQTFSHAETLEARHHWMKIQAETNVLSRNLCEKLRLVMEPLVATKLKGDYRTGKRINMKRVIGYIASGYRKDKIWLRRTKPAKRNYRVLLAVDDSESMKKSGAGEMALAALATLANGMSQLEIGELGIASFGEDMKLLHPFNSPFTSESGANLVRNFKFDDQRTRTALCVESAIAALESESESTSSLQLVFIISDGRIERDSRQKLRKQVREMSERNILLVMIIVEGKKGERAKEKDSIVHMKEVTFEKGKPKIKHFIDDYPFPYYLVLEDMNSLPEILGDALRQWFEMLAQLQSSST